jgi:hypothetical protein
MRRQRTTPPKRDAAWAEKWLPLFAARLCAQLHGEPLPKAPDKYRVGPGRKLTPTIWHELLRRAQRTTVANARRELKIPEWLVGRVLRREPRLAAWYRRAIPLGDRSPYRPSLIQMTAIFGTLVRTPGMSARTACKLHNVRYSNFLKATARPEWESTYLRAKALQRGQSFAALDEQIVEAPKLTRVFKRGINQTVNRLRRLEPRRLWPKRELTPQQQLLRDARRRARQAQQRRPT